jgi:hypothetical protein
MPQTNGSGSYYFQDANKKPISKKVVSEGIFTSFFKDQKSKRSQKTVGPKTCGSGGSGTETLVYCIVQFAFPLSRCKA